MHREAVDSSSVAEVGYDVGERVLEVAFVRGGIYQYHGVTPEEYAGLLGAPSKGRYVNGFIKPRYVYQRVGGQ